MAPLAWRMSEIMTLCAALSLAGAGAGFRQPAAVRTAGSQGGPSRIMLVCADKYSTRRSGRL